MILSSYEIHHFHNPLLPFIFYPCYRLPEQEMAANWHKNIEILCCLAGSGYVRCGPDTYDFSTDDIVVIHPDMLHTVGGTLEYSCLIIGNSFCADNGFQMENLRFHNVIRDPALVEAMQKLTQIHTSFDGSPLCAVADYRYAVLGILRKLCRDHCSVKGSSTAEASDEHIKKAITYIRTNLDKKMTLDDIAAHIGISKFHLSREFKSFTGNTIIGFINALRCSEAKRLIEKGMRVAAAAYTCGFENMSYFSKTFQKIIGCTPSSLIKK